MVKNFKQSKIYKIESIYSNDDEPIYIGSTTKSYLSQRMTAHRSGYKRYNKTGLGFMSSYVMFDKYGIDNCKISLLENVDANNSDELKVYEAKYIKLLNCVNINYNQIIKKPQNFNNMKIQLIKELETGTNTDITDESILNHPKLKLFINLIKDLGYNYTKKHITGEELITNFKNIFSNSELYINQKAAKINYNIPYFNFDDKTTSIRQLLGHLNTILRVYSLKISKHQQTIKNKKNYCYKIEILKDVDKLIKCKVEEGYILNHQ